MSSKSLILSVIAAFAMCVSVVSAQTTLDPERDGRVYPVSGFSFVYARELDGLEPLDGLGSTMVELSLVDGVYIAPRDGSEGVKTSLDDLVRFGPVDLSGSAMSAVLQAVRAETEDRLGLIGHLVTPSPEEIAFETTQEDLRGSGSLVLTVLIWPADVALVRTIARGERIAEREHDDDVSNVNHPLHSRVRGRITLAQGDLLTKKNVDSPVFRLNRHPGRRVDVSISPSEERGSVVVDYLITEPKQWSAYASVSNTGTKSTDEWREHFGFVHRQLTNNDDVLQIDYITASFDEVHALLASYEFDVTEQARGRVHGRWNQYTASDVGLGFENFEGEGYEVGAELALNVWEDGPAFVDLVGGIRFEHTEVDNRVLLVQGDEDFLLPFIALRYEKSTPLHNVFGEVKVETNLADAAGTSEVMIANLGRPMVENEFTRLTAQLTHSFYLEPIFDPEGFRGDRGPDDMTLAHEMVIRVRGQSTFGSRLAPSYQFIAGGAATVRGYDESVAAGDSGVVASLEYRYHLGKATPIASTTTDLFGSRFRSSRTQPFGSADWDLILSGFVDIGRVAVQNALFFESDETLIGAGVGIEAQLRRNLTVRLQYAMAFTRIGEQVSPFVATDVGDSRLHFAATFVY